MDMTLTRLLVFLAIAGICGVVAQAVVGYSHGGLLTSILLGLVGALVGPWIASALGAPDSFRVTVGGESVPVVWSTVGAALLVTAISLMTGGRAQRRSGGFGTW